MLVSAPTGYMVFHAATALRTAAVTATAALAVTALAGCAVIARLDATPKQVVYPAWTDAPHTADPEVTPAAFVPHDAVAVYVRTSTTNGAAIMTYTSKTAPNASQCHAATLTGKPKLDANWWPIGTPPAEGLVCSPGWQVFTHDGATFGWTNPPKH
jgi:hypothetical protein